MTGPAWLAAVLAAAVVLVLLALPAAGGARLAGLRPGEPGPRVPRRARREASLRVRQCSWGAAAGVPVWLWLGPAAGVAAGMLVHAAAAAASRRARRRADDEELARAVEACSAVAAELRAGRTPPEALAAGADVAVAGVGEALRAAAQAAAAGGDAGAVLAAARVSAAAEPLRALAACWRVCAATGSALAPAVDRIADGLADDAARRRAVAAEVAGPQATAALLAGLPVAGLALGAGLGAAPAHVLLETPLGGACLVAGVVLDLLGLAWTRRLVAHALRA